MASKFLNALKDAAIVGGLVAFHYFVIPWLISVPIYMAWYFAIVVSISNVIAIMTSWVYFSHTRCYDDEGNFVTALGYKTIGANATHFIIFISRVVGNIVLLAFVFKYPMMLNMEVWIYFFYLKIFLLTISFTTSLYVYEMVNNIIAISGDGMKHTCKDKSYVCSLLKEPIPFYCDFQNDQDGKGKKKKKQSISMSNVWTSSSLSGPKLDSSVEAKFSVKVRRKNWNLRFD